MGKLSKPYESKPRTRGHVMPINGQRIGARLGATEKTFIELRIRGNRPPEPDDDGEIDPATVATRSPERVDALDRAKQCLLAGRPIEEAAAIVGVKVWRVREMIQKSTGMTVARWVKQTRKSRYLQRLASGDVED